MKLDDDIGARLTAARQRRKLSREEASNLLGAGYSVSAIQAHENGRNALRPASILAYCRLYGIATEWLLTGTGSPNDPDSEFRDILANIAEQGDREAWLAIGRRLAEASE